MVGEGAVECADALRFQYFSTVREVRFVQLIPCSLRYFISYQLPGLLINAQRTSHNDVDS